MVCKLFEILDENEIKQLSKIEYIMAKPEYIYDFENEIRKYKIQCLRAEWDKNAMIVTVPGRGQGFKYPFTQSDYDTVCTEYNTLINNDFMQKWLLEWECNKNSMPKMFWKYKTICDYMNVIPFTPSVMINISPDWSESKLTTEFGRTAVLKKLIDSYMQEQWYEKWEYVIENGSDGKHIHAHIVAKMNTKRLKSVESHLKKGNNTQQLKKYAKGIKGIQGCIKGNSVQKVFLRTEEIVKDKLLYLHEDTKPQGHKNQSIIKDGYIVGCL